MSWGRGSAGGGHCSLGFAPFLQLGNAKSPSTSNIILMFGAAAPEQAAQLAEALQKDFHYTVDEKQRSVLLTEDGYEAAEDVLQARDVLRCGSDERRCLH